MLESARRTDVDDIISAPDAVLIDARPIKSLFPKEPFDYIEFLKQDPRFFATWRRYRKVDSALDYDIWLRTDEDR